MKDLAKLTNLNITTKMENNMNKIAWSIRNGVNPFQITDILTAKVKVKYEE